MNALLLKTLQLALFLSIVAGAPMAWANDVQVGFSKFGRSDSETFFLEEARQLDSYKFPLENPKEVAAFANHIGFLEDSNLSLIREGSIWKPAVFVRKVSLKDFVADIQRDYEGGLLSRAEYLSAIGETVPTGDYWRVSFGPPNSNSRNGCTIAIKPSGRVLERWSEGCAFQK